MDLLRRDAARDDDLLTLAVLRRRESRRGDGGGHLLVRLVVVPDPDRFTVGNAEVNPDDRASAASPQLAKPLVRDVEVACDRDREDAAGVGAMRPSEAADAVAPDQGSPRLRGQMDEHGHRGVIPTVYLASSRRPACPGR